MLEKILRKTWWNFTKKLKNGHKNLKKNIGKFLKRFLKTWWTDCENVEMWWNFNENLCK